jgi:hypothetical protein
VSRLEVFLIVASVLNAAAVIEFVRRRKLQESFAMLWVVLSVIGILAALLRSQLDRLASALGVAYGATLFLAAGIVVLVFVCMALSLHVSRLQTQVEVLAEEVAFLRGVAEPEVPEGEPGFAAPLDPR